MKSILSVLILVVALTGCSESKKPNSAKEETKREVIAFVTEPSESTRVMVTLTNLDGPFNFVRTDANLKNGKKVMSEGPISEKEFRNLLESIVQIKEFTDYVEPAGDAPLDLQANYIVSTMNSSMETVSFYIPKEGVSDEMKSWVDNVLEMATK